MRQYTGGGVVTQWFSGCCCIYKLVAIEYIGGIKIESYIGVLAGWHYSKYLSRNFERIKTVSSMIVPFFKQNHMNLRY